MDAKGIAASTIGEMAGRYSQDKTFWESGNAAAGADENFRFKDWLRAVRMVPELRKELLLAGVWNLLCPRRERRGFSERLIPGRKYNFRYRSFCTDFLVWESMGRALRHFGVPLPAAWRGDLQDCIALAFENCYSIAHRGGQVGMFSYYPRRDHLVPAGHQVHDLFFSKDINTADNDSTCIILASVISLVGQFGLPPRIYGHGEEETRLLLDLLSAHVFGEGEFGRHPLSYLNGARPGDRGVLTWIFDKHNELDPTSNVNVLNYLALIRRIHPGLPGEELGRLSGKILGFLRDHADDGSLLDVRFQQYYPLGSAYFFWHRFASNFAELEPAARAELDPGGAMPAIEERLRSEGGRIFRDGGAQCNPYDLILAAPFLFSQGLMREELATLAADPEKALQPFRGDHYEIFHMLYPSKIICAPEMIPFAAYLELLVLVDKIR